MEVVRWGGCSAPTACAGGRTPTSPRSWRSRVAVPPRTCSSRADGSRTGRSRSSGRDPRASGEMLEAAVVAGLTSAGANVVRVGVLPTPAVAFLIAEPGADLGVMLSRLPQPDAGQRHQAVRPRRAQAARRDRGRDRARGSPRGPWTRPTGAGVGRVHDLLDGAEHYVEHLLGTLPHPLDGLKVVVDCANGAASEVAPGGLTAGRRRGHRDRRRAGRPEHQRRLRLDPPRRPARRGPARRRRPRASRTTATPTAAWR